MSGKDVLPEKDLLRKAATITIFEYSPLGKELNAQTDIAKKQYQKLDNTCDFIEIIEKQKATLENYSKSDLTCNSNYSCYKYYRDSKKFDNYSLESKHCFLAEIKLNSQTERTKEK